MNAMCVRCPVGSVTAPSTLNATQKPIHAHAGTRNCRKKTITVSFACRNSSAYAAITAEIDPLAPTSGNVGSGLVIRRNAAPASTPASR